MLYMLIVIYIIHVILFCCDYSQQVELVFSVDNNAKSFLVSSSSSSVVLDFLLSMKVRQIR